MLERLLLVVHLMERFLHEFFHDDAGFQLRPFESVGGGVPFFLELAQVGEELRMLFPVVEFVVFDIVGGQDFIQRIQVHRQFARNAAHHRVLVDG